MADVRSLFRQVLHLDETPHRTALAFAIDAYGAGPFVFSSDFPHEVNDESIREEIDGLLGNDALDDAAKAAVLGGNAARFYGLD